MYDDVTDVGEQCNSLLYLLLLQRSLAKWDE